MGNIYYRFSLLKSLLICICLYLFHLYPCLQACVYIASYLFTGYITFNMRTCNLIIVLKDKPSRIYPSYKMNFYCNTIKPGEAKLMEVITISQVAVGNKYSQVLL